GSTANWKNVGFGGKASGSSYDLVIDGNALFGDSSGDTVNVKTLSVSGTSDINGGIITTSGTQVYKGNVNLGLGTTLNAGSSGSFENISFNGNISGSGKSLTVNGNALFGDGTESDSVTLQSLTVNGETNIYSVSITTSDSQNYKDNVTLSSSTSLFASKVTFEKKINGAYSLSVTGNAEFDGVAGDVSSLTSLSVSGASAIDGGSVKTNGNQTYSGDVTLGDNTTLTAGSTGNWNNVSFGGKMSGSSYDLVIDGNAVFGNEGGDTVTVKTLAVSGKSELNTNNVTTTGTQVYKDDVTVGASSCELSGITVTFQKNITGGNIIVKADFVSDGTVSASNDITVTQNFTTNSGTSFTQTSGIMKFTGSYVTVSGSSTFYDTKFETDSAKIQISGNNTYQNLSFTGKSQEVKFTAGTVQTVNGILKVTGDSGTEIKLLSSQNGSEWKISFPVQSDDNSKHFIDYAQIQDSVFTGTPKPAAAWHSKDLGNNTDWIFPSHNYEWTGANHTNLWTDKNNWTPSTVPGKGAYVLIPAGCDYYPKLADTLDMDYSSALKGTIEIAYASSKPGMMDLGGQSLTAGTLVVDGRLRLEGQESFGNIGSVSRGQNSTVEYYGNNASTKEWISKAGDYINLIVENTCELKSESSSASEIKTVNLTNEGTLTVNASTVTDSKDLTVTGTLSNKGTVNINSGRILKFKDYSGNGSEKICISSGVLTHTGAEDALVKTLEITAKSQLNGTTVSGNVLKFTDALYSNSNIETTGNVRIPGTSGSDEIGNITAVSGTLENTGVIYCAALNSGPGQSASFTCGQDINAASVSIGVNGKLNAASYNITVRGNWSDDSSSGFDSGTGKVIFAGTDITVKENSSFNDVETESTKITLASNLTVNSTFTYKNALTIAEGSNNIFFRGAVSSKNTAENLSVSGSGSTEFNSTLGNVKDLIIGGNAKFDDTVTCQSVYVIGATQVNGGTITTNGTQQYDGKVTLGKDTLLTAKDNSNVLQAVSFGDEISGASFALTVDGNAVFGVGSGDTVETKALYVKGTSTINGGKITTLETQTYDGDVTIGTVFAELISGTTQNPSSVIFNEDVLGLGLKVSGNLILGDSVSDKLETESLEVTGSSEVHSKTVTTKGTQKYNGTVNLLNEVVITAKESSVLKSVMFNSKITGSSYPLSIDGNAVFGDGNDDSVNVQSLTVLGTSEINGGSINTSGNQSYGKAVSLG
ncbi:MAG: hypothetical protein HUK25_04905, partial [Treponema sp.]|nr:hypothetical protein [Treponema sp.]